MNQNSAPNNRDPAQRPWVWVAFLLLLAGLIPMWPIEGLIFGVPTWAAFAVFMSVLLSLFATFVIFCSWPDSEEERSNDNHESD